MAKFEVVFWANDDKKGSLEVEADYFRDIESKGWTEFIDRTQNEEGGTNIVLRITTDEIFYIRKFVTALPVGSVTVHPQIEKFYTKYPQAV